MTKNIILTALFFLALVDLKSQDTIKFRYIDTHNNCDSFNFQNTYETMILKDTINGKIVSGSNMISYIFWKRNYIQICDSLILYKSLNG